MFRGIFFRIPQKCVCNTRSSSTSSEIIRTELNNGTKRIIMCDTKTRNSLSKIMMNQLIKTIEEDQNNPNLRVMVISADGPVFSAGHNLKELTPESGKKEQEQVFQLASKLMHSIIDSPVPVIAKVDGLAAAAGCQLVAQCDIALCSESSGFSTPGANFGIFCSTPGVALARCINKMTALHMLLTGKPLSAQDARISGLVWKVCPANVLDKEVDEICEAIKSKSRSVIELGKKFYYQQVQYDVKKAYQLGGTIMVENLQMDDGKEGIRSFVEKRRPIWKN